mgnify:CR=1 FL=1
MCIRDRPKSLISIGGKTLLERTIENLVTFGIKEIVINVSWLSELIMSQIGDGKKYGAKIHWSEEVSPLETGGGIFKALDILGNKPFITINGDIWIEPEAIKLLLDNYKVHMEFQFELFDLHLEQQFYLQVSLLQLDHG